jgi:ribulose-5-phosphate 4-epimerase/fuculose-1-phosphate aldolase
MSSPAIKIQKTVREEVGEAEWEVRVQLAAAYRLVYEHGWTEMVGNHISARVPGSHCEFLINPFGMLYDEVNASSLVRIDLDGNILYNRTDYGINQAGFVIHSAIHAARHDVECVAHTHTEAGMAVSAMECGMLPLSQSSMRFGNVAYHDFEGIAVDLEERERLVKDLGDNDFLMLKNHGLLVCGRTIGHAFYNLFFMERACETQVMAMAANTKLNLVPQKIIDETNARVAQVSRKGNGKSMPVLAFEGLMRRLDRKDPSYRN